MTDDLPEFTFAFALYVISPIVGQWFSDQHVKSNRKVIRQQTTKGADGSSSKEGKSERKDNIEMEPENKGCQQGMDTENKGCFGKAQGIIISTERVC